ncbi:MAG: glycerophosphodiester phosphodiesterase [Candidatus Sulfotelmatobacter sp.]
MQIRPLLLGHRGARSQKSVPENTLDSFDLALAHGCDGFEFDVRLSVDRHPVICHDDNIRGLEVAQTSAQRLSQLTLLDVLKRYQASAFLDIELKVSGLEIIALEALRAHPPARGYVVSSFLPEVLQALQGIDASIPLGLICETRAQFRQWPTVPAKYILPHHKLARQNTFREIQRAGRKVFVWTVNLASDIKRFAEWGADGIISDDPERLAVIIGRQSGFKIQK